MPTSSVNFNNSTRITGMVSGLDTDSVVEKLTSGTTEKINKIYQQKQLLLWKQEDYKSIISKLKSFSNKYLGSSFKSSLSSSFYAIKTATSVNSGDSSYAGLTVSSSSNVSSVSLSNIELATSAKAVTQNTVCQQITLGFDAGSAPIDLTGKTMELTVDGVTKTITFSSSYDTAAQLAADIKALADSAFGTDRLTVTESGGLITVNSDGTAATLAPGTVNDAFSAAGLTLQNDKTNRIDITKSIAQNSFATPVTGDSVSFTINGKSFTFGTDASIASIINTINASDAGVKLSYSSLTDRFTMTGTATGAGNGISLSDETGNFLSSIIGPLTAENYTQGTDSSVYINGVKVTRATNTFNIDGITYSLRANTSSEIIFNVTNDTDAAVGNIKELINDYNELLDLINSKLYETRYKDYAPLTDDQKAEMSDSEITKWEEKARSGLLKNDTLLTSIASSLRAAFYTPVMSLADNTVGINISMSSVGISTESYASKGKLVVNEQKLKEALSNNPEGVINLFTQKSDKIYLPSNTAEVKNERYLESGIMFRISDILEGSVGTLYGSGSLLKVAGFTGTSTEADNTITRSIAGYQKRLDSLLDYLTRERTRYYNQFTAMEKSISELNQQIQWVTGSNN